MKDFSTEEPNGYLESIQKGVEGLAHFSRILTYSRDSADRGLERLSRELRTADALVVGAGAGLSTAAGLTYSGDRFLRYFSDFAENFGIRDMYSGGFFPFPDDETRWAWWARHIYYNRYVDAPVPVYRDLLSLLEGRDCFVITTNVDHQFQRAGFDKKRLFYTQGDYGLFQSVDPDIKKTFDNEEWVNMAMQAQGFVRDAQGVFQVPDSGKIHMRLPADLIPVCPDNGSAVAMNLRADDSFVEDEGWHRASAAYARFLRKQEGRHVLYLELGVGANTPVIIKYPFWQMTLRNPEAVYACVNLGQAYCPEEIGAQSICIDGDIAEVLSELRERA